MYMYHLCKYKGCGILVMLFILVVWAFNFQCRSLHETKMPQKKGA